jgi:hypothetical protein
MIVVEGNRCKAEMPPALRAVAQPDIADPGCGDAPGTVSHLMFPTDYFAFS